MLLRHTTAETIVEREALTINPAKTCQPIGAMYAALGIHKCLPHSHGSQGCCSYHRSMLTRHFKEPVMAATSAFTEGASVFGGQANLVEALGNIFSIYNPDIVAIHTTCLSETIGDDCGQIASKALESGKIPAGKVVINTSTPSYVGSHITGFSNMVKSMVTSLSESTKPGKDNVVNIIPGFVDPSDMEEIKRLAGELGVKTILFPDTSNVVNGPMTGKFHMYPAGGTTIEELRATGDSKATLALGPSASGAAAKALDTKCKVPCQELELPIGLQATDRFVDALRKVAGVTVPESINRERGQLLDMMTDMHQYTYGRKVAIAGDPDHLVSLVEFLVSLDMKPIHIVTGTPGKKIAPRFKASLEKMGRPGNLKAPGDLFHLHQWIKQEPVDLILGNTHCKYIARDEDTPLVRVGFPIIDRVGHQYMPTLGYRGAIRLLEKILSALMDRQDRDAPEESFELVM
ncbi:nitrogenase molybdenum-iron protein subunit beta [Holophaga foetida]|uniref:nitrogenase molybdenum-iron protein subunit beta n=1 Tax=Holophaga foetida TaxID=35839 RepID=UPI0002473310|nr:nitrogenase molybdenum-iron protein subunit beta [Holophaga foetida]